MRFSCNDIQERWPEYIYRELSDPEQSLFVRHLEDCSDCRNQESEWRRLLGRFDSIATLDGATDAPPELVYRVKRQIHLFEDWSNQFSSRMRRWTVATTAACVLLTSAFWLSISTNPSPHRSTNPIPSPIQNTVLQSLYGSDTLKVFHEQEIIAEIKRESSSQVANTLQKDEELNSFTDAPSS